MNSIRRKHTDKIWTVADFIGDGLKRSEHDMRVQSADEIYKLLMQYMPPPAVQ